MAEFDEGTKRFLQNEESAFLFRGISDACYLGDEQAAELGTFILRGLLDKNKPKYVAAMIDGLSELCGYDEVIDGIKRNMAGNN